MNGHTPEPAPDYDAWNAELQRLAGRGRAPQFREWEVWWAALGVGVGVEVQGKGAHFTRPVLILRKLGRAGCVAAPLTTRERDGGWYVPLDWGRGPRWVMLNQMRFIAAERLRNREAALSERHARTVRRALGQFWHL